MNDFSKNVYLAVQKIPRGKVTNYGCIAFLAGKPRAARGVGFVLHRNPDPVCIPCHRVVFKDGRMATGFAFGGPDEQRRMLAAEGVAFDEEGRVIMEEFQWDGRPESATSGEGDVPTGPPPDFDWEAELAEHPLHHCETCAAPRPDCQKKRRT